MKKLLGIIVLGLLLCGNAYAGCSDFLDFEWKFIGKDRTTHVKSERAYFAKFTFKSSSEKTINITQTHLSTASGKKVDIDKYKDFTIKPFGKSSDLMYGMQSLNLDVVTSGGYHCNYYSPTNTSTNKKKTNNNRSKKTEENSTLVLLVVFGIIGLVIYMLAKKGQAIPSTSKISSIQKLPKNSVKILTITEFNKKIKSYIPGHQLSDLPRIGDVEGQEFQCGCGSSHIMNFDQHYFIADGGIYKAVFLSPDCKYLNALKLKGPMTSGIQNLFSTKYLANKPKYGFDDYPDIAGAIDKFFMR